ncbi:MAG: hypothetical protein QOE48_6375, partial [Mycobacterium sp.]|nr:hypothetical protein [Mycobacterium sp.]
MTGLQKGDGGSAQVVVQCTPQRAWDLIGDITR